MLFQSYFSMVFKPIHPAKLVTTSLFSRSRVEPIAVGPKNHPEIGQHFRYIYIYMFFFLCNCYDIPISMDCWENRHRKPIKFSEKSGFDFSFSQVTRHFLAMPKCCGRHAGAFRCAVSGGTFQSLEN